MKNLAILLDPAHGADVKGKRSPDGKHLEFLWSRERVKSIKSALEDRGYSVYVTTESMDEPGLSVRKQFASNVCKGKRKLLISLHNNAAGNGNAWMNARGAEVYTTPGVTDSDICAEYILEQLKKDFPNIKMRYNKDKELERDKEERFTVLMGSGYMAVLVEWLFQDNREDAELLTDEETNRKFERSIVESIEHINGYFKE